MGFESGSLSCRLFTIPGGLPGDAIARFDEHAAPPIDLMTHGTLEGWVTSRHLLDRNIHEDTAVVAGYPFVYLARAEKKIPRALLQAECRMEELAVMQAENRAYLKRSERSEIKKSVVDRLLPTMPPTLRGIALVIDPRDNTAYAAATTDSQLDALTRHFQQAQDRPLVPLMPLSAAAQRRRLDLRDLRPTCFVPDFELAGQPDTVGLDFLTWLWFVTETRHEGKTLDLGEAGEFGVLIEGPLTFEFEGEGAHETTLRKGTPRVAYEARAALMAGKKLARAQLTLARNEQLWTCAIDGGTFVIRGLKLPKGDAQDPVSRFEERMLALRAFREAFLALYDRFLDERIDEPRWEQVCKDIFLWIDQRTVKR